jgi:hypothetical protein
MLKGQRGYPNSFSNTQLLLTLIFFSFAIFSYSSFSFFDNFLGIFIKILINKSHFESLSMCLTQSQEIFSTVWF